MARTSRIFHRVALISAFSSALLLAGCASAPPPTDALDQARLMLDSARTAQAPVYAPLDLGSAQALYDQAQQAVANKDYDAARRFAGEAEAAAELARAKSQLGALREDIRQQTRQNAQLSRQLLGTQAQPAAAPPPGGQAPAAPAPASSALQTYPASAGSTGGTP